MTRLRGTADCVAERSLTQGAPSSARRGARESKKIRPGRGYGSSFSVISPVVGVRGSLIALRLQVSHTQPLAPVLRGEGGLSLRPSGRAQGAGAMTPSESGRESGHRAGLAQGRAYVVP